MTTPPDPALETMDRLVALAGKRVVDAGCGDGALARAMVARGASVVALEPEPGQARRNRLELAGDAIAFHQTGAEAMPCADASMDGVVFSKSLHHVPMALMVQALEEAMRVLEPRDGFLYVLEPESGGSHTELMRPFHDETRPREAARELLESFVRPRFRAALRTTFTARSRYDDFESFADRVCGYGYNGYRRGDVDTPRVRALFEAGRDPGGGYSFEQPMRVDLFTGPCSGR